MTEISAVYYDGQASKVRSAKVVLDATGKIFIELDQGTSAYAIEDVRISPRIGNTTRSLYFATGAKCESLDNDKIDEFIAAHPGKRRGLWLHRLESRWYYVLTASVLTPLIVAAFIHFGIPTFAEQAAQAIPASMNKALSEQVLETMDATIFEPSTVASARREQLTKYLEAITANTPNQHHYQLEFRYSKKIGANAFALPSGIIILTDDLLAIAEDNRELIAILAHEVGHIVHRHSLRQTIQGSIITLLIATLTGEIISMSSLAATMPVALVEAKYSRQFETEADHYALQYLSKNNISPQYFIAILERLEQAQGHGKNATGFLDSHPASSERAKLLQNLQKTEPDGYY